MIDRRGDGALSIRGIGPSSLVVSLVALAGCSFPDYTTTDGVDLHADTAPDTVEIDAADATDAADSTVESDTAADALDGSVVDTADAAPKSCTTLGGTVSGGHCYWLIPTVMTEPAAKTACLADGGHLVTITSAAENKFVWDLATGLARWIGLEAPTPSTVKTAFVWVTGEAKVYEAWNTFEPSGTGACVRMNPASGLWSTRACDAGNNVTCERETP